jgi:N-methylhydantoinase B
MAEFSIESDGKLMNDMPRYGIRPVKNPRFVLHSSGGGGWGDPRRRDPSLVARDVKDEIVSVTAARDLYGVAVDASGKLDEAATSRLRAAAAE